MKCALSCLMILSLLIVPPCFGQISDERPLDADEMPQDERHKEKPGNDGLELPIIVTAQRRAQIIVDVPASIDLLTIAQIKSAAAVHPAELLNASAGVNIHRGSGQEHLTSIRSPVLTGGAGAGSFLYLEDGVPLRAAGFGNVNGLFESPAELSGNIEVFKGPGSVLYGSNAVHGLINLRSRAPKNEAGADLQLMGSSRGLASVTGSVTGSGMRASLSLAHDDGFRSDSGFDQQKLTLRKDANLAGWESIWLTSAQNLNQETAGFIQGADAYKDDALARTNLNPEAYRDARSARTQLRLSRVLEGGHKLVLTPYARTSRIEFLRHFIPGQAMEDNGHSSAGLLSSLYGPDWIAGFDADFTRGYLKNLQDNPTRFRYPEGEHYDFETQALVLAAYGQKHWDLPQDIRAQFGLRAELTRYDYDNTIDSGVFGRIKRIDDRGDEFLTLTPTASLTYQPRENRAYYARFARGARAAQITDLYALQIDQVPADAKSETLDSFDIGIKATHWSLAAYAMQKNNFFFRKSDGFNQTDGQTHHIGIEGQLVTSITNWLSLRASGTYARHTYAFNDSVSNISDGGDVDSAPRTLGTLALIAKPTDRIESQLEWRHVGKYFTDAANTQSYDGHDIFVLRGRFQISSALSIFTRVDNVLDTAYADRADYAFGAARYFPGRPRTVFLGLSSSY